MGLSHLARDLKNCDEFIACGRESVPVEMQPGTDPAKPKTDARVGERGGGGGGPSLPPSETSRNSVRSSQSLDRLDSGEAFDILSVFSAASKQRRGD